MARAWSWVQTASGGGLLQDCQGRLGTQVAAHLALSNHQFQPLHRQRAGTEHCQARTAGEDRSCPRSMALQHLQHRLLVSVPLWVHRSTHRTQILRRHQNYQGQPANRRSSGTGSEVTLCAPSTSSRRWVVCVPTPRNGSFRMDCGWRGSCEKSPVSRLGGGGVSR
jgi:hypothetical protein